jgi:hypothetical protein
MRLVSVSFVLRRTMARVSVGKSNMLLTMESLLVVVEDMNQEWGKKTADRSASQKKRFASSPACLFMSVRG